MGDVLKLCMSERCGPPGPTRASGQKNRVSLGLSVPSNINSNQTLRHKVQTKLKDSTGEHTPGLPQPSTGSPEDGAGPGSTRRPPELLPPRRAGSTSALLSAGPVALDLPEPCAVVSLQPPALPSAPTSQNPRPSGPLTLCPQCPPWLCRKL